MRIGFDVRMWSESGIGRYTRNIIRRLVALDTTNEYVLFGLSKDREMLEEIILESNGRWKFIVSDYPWYSFSEQTLFARLLLSYPLDLVHFPHFNVPLLYTRPFVVTIHDLTHFNFKMQRASTLSPVLYQLKHHAYSLVFRNALVRSKKIFTVSDYVKQQLLHTFSIPESKISVTYESVDDSFIRTVATPVSVNKPYFLYVGNAHPHKNIEFLLRVFSAFRSAHPEYWLVLVGKENFFWHQIHEYSVQNHLDDHVVFQGYVDDSQLVYLYAHATAYVFPSLSEGFGLPILEAMHYGCPVLTSNRTSLPEVGADSVLYFDPENEASLIEALTVITGDQSVRQKYSDMGHERIMHFSWSANAAQLIEAYSQI